MDTGTWAELWGAGGGPVAPWHKDTDSVWSAGVLQRWQRGKANPGMGTKIPVCNRADMAERFPESHPAKALM